MTSYKEQAFKWYPFSYLTTQNFRDKESWGIFHYNYSIAMICIEIFDIVPLLNEDMKYTFWTKNESFIFTNQRWDWRMREFPNIFRIRSAQWYAHNFVERIWKFYFLWSTSRLNDYCICTNFMKINHIQYF